MPYRVTWILMVALATIGCASVTPRYIEPEEGANARLRVATTSNGLVQAFTYADETCTVGEAMLGGIRAGYFFSPEEKRLGMPLWSFHENAAKEFRINPGLFVVKFEGLFDGGSVSMTCNSAFVFEAASGVDYEVLFTHTVDFPRQRCNVAAAKLTQRSGKFVREPLSPARTIPAACIAHKARPFG